jgi:hypothetical protein
VQFSLSLKKKLGITLPGDEDKLKVFPSGDVIVSGRKKSLPERNFW